MRKDNTNVHMSQQAQLASSCSIQQLDNRDMSVAQMKLHQNDLTCILITIGHALFSRWRNMEVLLQSINVSH